MDTKSSNVISGRGGVDSSPEVSASPPPLFPTRDEIEDFAAEIRALRYSLTGEIRRIESMELILDKWAARATKGDE